MTSISEPTAVTYEGLPVGSGAGHKLGRIGLRDAYSRTADFIAACAVPSAPRRQYFLLPDVPGLADRPAWEPALYEQFGIRTEGKIHLPDREADAALSFLEEVHPQPENQWGMAPLRFVTDWKISLLDPATGAPFPGQTPTRYPGLGYDNWVRLTLDNRASLQIELCIPDLDDDRLRELVPVLQSHAPFRFSSQQWRRWRVTKTGSFVSRKIDIS